MTGWAYIIEKWQFLVLGLILLLSSTFHVTAQDSEPGNTISISNMSEIREIRSFQSRNDQIPLSASPSSLAIGPNGHSILVTYVDLNVEATHSIVRLVDTQNNTSRTLSLPHIALVLGISPQGNLFTVLDVNALLQVYDSRTGNIFKQWDNARVPPLSVKFSPDGNFLAFADSNAQRIVFWDLQQNILAAEIRDTGASALAFSPNGSNFAYESNHQIYVCSGLPELNILCDSVFHSENSIFNLMYTSDGQRIILDGLSEFAVLDLQNPENVHLYPRVSLNRRLLYRQSGNIAATLVNGETSLFDAISEESRSNAFVEDLVAMNSDESIYAAAVSFNTIRLIPVATGQPFADLIPNSTQNLDEIRAVEFSPTNEYLVTLEINGWVRLWGIEE